MPRYSFDTEDGDRADRDGVGLAPPDASTARWQAIDTLPDMARDTLPTGDRHSFEVRVRDQAGTVISSATLDLVGEWHVTPPT